MVQRGRTAMADLGLGPDTLAGQVAVVTGAVSDAEAARFAASLEKLVAYYEGMPAETARFTRDAELLRQVAQLTQARVATIEKLAGALRAWRTA